MMVQKGRMITVFPFQSTRRKKLREWLNWPHVKPTLEKKRYVQSEKLDKLLYLLHRIKTHQSVKVKQITQFEMFTDETMLDHLKRNIQQLKHSMTIFTSLVWQIFPGTKFQKQ